jgi:hypothetical protein
VAIARMKPQGYAKLTKDEKDALLQALFNQHDPIQAVKKEITQMLDELNRIIQKHGKSSPQTIKWERHCATILPLLHVIK